MDFPQLLGFPDSREEMLVLHLLPGLVGANMAPYGPAPLLTPHLNYTLPQGPPHTFELNNTDITPFLLIEIICERKLQNRKRKELESFNTNRVLKIQ